VDIKNTPIRIKCHKPSAVTNPIQYNCPSAAENEYKNVKKIALLSDFSNAKNINGIRTINVKRGKKEKIQ
jgi:hypothetical protein